MPLFTQAWWKATGQRVLATVLAALLGIITPLMTGSMTTLTAASMLAMTALVTAATALAGLPEVTGETLPVWKAVIHRTAKTLGQTAAAGIGTALLLSDVDWRVLATSVASATAITLIRTLIAHLPETATSGLDTTTTE